jgi:hypothetical protein
MLEQAQEKQLERAEGPEELNEIMAQLDDC